MAEVTPDGLWRLIVATRLCSRRAAAILRSEHHAAATAADASAVATWLVDRGVLTRWQATQIAAGDDGPFIVGDYRLLERHQHDGAASEYTARHEPSGRIATLVRMPRRLVRDRVIRDAILRRAGIAARVADPLLVGVEAIEEVDGAPIVICEEVRGERLADELARRGPLPLSEAGAIALAVARALAELHAAGEVHGGLSLDALVREWPAVGGRLRLRQFPLATDPLAVPQRAPIETEEAVTALGRRAAFVAPELVSGAACDARSDVYALGCVLHALATGAAPGWRGDAHDTLARAVKAGPGSLGPTFPAPLVTLVNYLTARDPQDRYPDAAEAAHAIATCFGLRPPDAAVAPGAAEAVPVSAVVATRMGPPTMTPAHRADIGRSTWRPFRRLPLKSLIIAGVLGAAAAAVMMLQPRPTATAPRHEESDPGRRTAPGAAAPAAVTRVPDDVAAPVKPLAAPGGAVNVDDPNLPWASPTAPVPLALEYLPPGSQVIVAARPAALLADDEGRRFVRALGPRVEQALAGVAAACGCRPEDIESLQAGWQADGDDDAVVGWTARLVEGKRVPSSEDVRTRTWGRPVPASRAGETMHAGLALAYWAPSRAAGRVLVAAPEAHLAEIIAASADVDPPPLVLPSDLERLVGALHGARHLTVVGAPHFLLNTGRGALGRDLLPLVDGVESLVGEDVPAAALSIHCGDDFFMELDAIPAIDLKPSGLVARFRERIAGLPDAVDTMCAARDLHPYARSLVRKLPAMLRVLAAQARCGVEGRIAVATVRLPRPAGHNLALATEVLLAQGEGGGTASADADAPHDAGARLARSMTLRFAKDTLEKSLQLISEEIGVPIEILGPDLQREGITKNQSFGLDESNKPAADILRVVLAKANPDGKLVYVIRNQGGVESIAITTRAAAAGRGEALPPAFGNHGAARAEESK